MDADFFLRELHDSTLYRIDFSGWPGTVRLFFWSSGSSYQLELAAVLAFQYEVSNLGEFALPAVDAYHVYIGIDDEARSWSQRLESTGFQSEQYDCVYHVVLASTDLRIAQYSDTSIGLSSFCRAYKFSRTDSSLVPEWLLKYGF